VHEHIRDLCRRFAKLGYFAIALELYARQGDVSKISNVQEIVDNVVKKVPDAQVMGDLDAAVAYAKASGQGGYFALRHHGILLGRADRVDVRRAQSGSEGRGCVVRAARPFILSRRQERSRRGEGPEAPVLGLYGGADQGIPVDTVNKMRDALRAAKKPGDLIVYPDTPHGFNADYRPSYRKEAADDGWKRLQSWFAVYGVV
jgi:carboxymethylenebutenolidase